MEEEKKEHESENEHSHEHHHKKINLTEQFRENPWMLATLICGLLIAFLLFSILNGGVITGNVSAKVAGEKLLNFYEAMGVEGLTLDSINEVSGLYEVNLGYQGKIIPIYITKDGKAFTESLTAIAEEKEEETTTQIPKSDKPSVELYIWSYCPYGVTALGPFSEVAKLLGNLADFKVYLYYAGHGDFEEQQNKIQACIQELNPSAYWDYAKTFAEEIYTKCSGDKECDLKESTTLMKSLGIDSAKVLSCVSSQGEALLEEHYNAAQDKGVTGSPTLIVNGAKPSVSRTAEAYKGAVCSAFNSVPSECGETLSSSSTTASGSC